MIKKTTKFIAEEEHTSFEKTRVEPTKVFDIDSLEDENCLSYLDELSLEELEYKIEFEKLPTNVLEYIKKIIKDRE